MLKEQFVLRKDKLVAEMGDGDLAVIFANEIPAMPVAFLQDKDFYYFTGLELPNAIYTVSKIKNKAVTMLFIERGIPEREVWEGKKMSIDEAKTLTGIDNVQYLDIFRSAISGVLQGVKQVLVNTLPTQMDGSLDKRYKFVQKARERNIQLSFVPLSTVMPKLRMEKDSWEIEQLQKAIDITEKGIRHIYQKAEAGMNECVLEAMLRFEAVASCAKHQGFSPIIAAGGNATTLHYEGNNCIIDENVLVLLDVGSAWNNYSADISRTFPISGKFTNRQKEVYGEVLHIQKSIIEMVKPGVTMMELNAETNKLMVVSLKKLVFIDEESDLASFFINFEHSYMGDLTIQFECPSGQIITVHQQGGGGTALGEPVDTDGDLTYEYNYNEYSDYNSDNDVEWTIGEN